VSQSSYFEIVQLENGDFALQPAGGGGAQLVKISFGEDAKSFLAGNDAVVARAMIQAAIHTVGALRDEEIKHRKFGQESKVIH